MIAQPFDIVIMENLPKRLRIPYARFYETTLGTMRASPHERGEGNLLDQVSTLICLTAPSPLRKRLPIMEDVARERRISSLELTEHHG